LGCIVCALLTGRHPQGGELFSKPLHPRPSEALDISALEAWWPNAAHFCSGLLTLDERERFDATSCLQHEWLQDLSNPDKNQIVRVGVVDHLAREWKHAQLRQVVMEHLLTKLSDSPFTCVVAAKRVKETSALEVGQIPPELLQMGISEDGLRAVLEAFGPDSRGLHHYEELVTGCADLAEDLLDHALWRVFMAAGEDHRGIMNADKLEQALSEGKGSPGDENANSAVGVAGAAAIAAVAGGNGNSMRHMLSNGKQPSANSHSPNSVCDIVRECANGRNEVAFEELKARLIRRQYRGL